ncbi:MAG: hypothetical protein A2V90_05080 [Gammaproteobacteria bacterium RBG_16_57_12]|nr:MAG: hypothetical protein A2V90_05080 [Gammaproteobacteria bacterium RBG_16_57_12]
MLVAIIALHGAALLLLSRLPHELALRPALLVAFIQAESPVFSTPAPSYPLPQPPHIATPQPQVPAASAPPVLTSRAETAATAPAVEPEPLEQEEAAVTNEAVPTLVPVARPPIQPAPVVPPRFDADYLDNPAPAYPPLSRRLREQGTVLLRVHVEPSGIPGQVELKQSSGHARLDQAALDTVQLWRFVPARQGGAAVAGWVIVPISFMLRS